MKVGIHNKSKTDLNNALAVRSPSTRPTWIARDGKGRSKVQLGRDVTNLKTDSDLIDALARLQEYGRQDGDVYETQLDRTRAQLEHDRVIALRDASQPFRRIRSEQLTKEREM